MKQAVFVAALAAASCGGPPEITEITGITHKPCVPLQVVISTDATPTQRDGVDRALELWNQYGFTKLSVTVGEEIPLRFEDASGVFHGLYDPDTGKVFINNDLTDPFEIAVVVAHELGHAMGLVHVPESQRPSVMNPGNLTLPPNPADDTGLRERCPTGP